MRGGTIMKTCQSCGHVYDDNMTFCPKCGIRCATDLEQTVGINEVQQPFAQEPAQAYMPPAYEQPMVADSMYAVPPQPRKTGGAFKIILAVVLAIAVLLSGVTAFYAFAKFDSPATESSLEGTWTVKVDAGKVLTILSENDRLKDELPDGAAEVLVTAAEMFKGVKYEFNVVFDGGECRLTLTDKQLEKMANKEAKILHKMVSEGTLLTMLEEFDLDEGDIDELLKQTNLTYADIVDMVEDNAIEEIVDVMLIVCKYAAKAVDCYDDGEYFTPELDYECNNGEIELSFQDNKIGKVFADIRNGRELIIDIEAVCDEYDMKDDEKDLLLDLMDAVEINKNWF